MSRELVSLINGQGGSRGGRLIASRQLRAGTTTGGGSTTNVTLVTNIVEPKGGFARNEVKKGD